MARLKTGILGAVLAFALCHPAVAASDVSNDSRQSNKAMGSAAASVAATQTATIISSAATGGFSGGGGFSPSGGGGGFSTSGPGAEKQSFDARMTGKAGGGGAVQNGVWMQGLWSNIDKSEQFLQSRGDVYSVMTGFDRRSAHLVGGVAVGYEHVDAKTLYNNGTYLADGYTLAPYGSITIGPQWTLDGSVGYTWIDSTTTKQSGAVNGAFDGGRWLASTNLVGGFSSGQWRFQPKLGLLYMEETQNRYTDSSGAAVDSNSFALGRATGGGKLGYALGAVLPYVKVMGEWDFKTPGSAPVNGGQYTSSDSSTGAVVGLGVEAMTRGITTSLEVNNNSVLRENLDIWSTVARFRWEF